MPAAGRLLTLSWTLSICLVLLRTHARNTQPLLPRGREAILPACQHVLFGTSGDVKATGRDLLLRPHVWLNQAISAHFQQY